MEQVWAEVPTDSSVMASARALTEDKDSEDSIKMRDLAVQCQRASASHWSDFEDKLLTGKVFLSLFLSLRVTVTIAVRDRVKVSGKVNP
jgi:hypothetical protein